jgi:DNA-binding NarL/FixJ family response regulator
MKQISILIVDDHPLIRKAWTFTISQDPRFKVIVETETGEAAVNLAGQLCPDIVIMDIGLPGINGIEATKMIKTNCPETKIIGLSFHINPLYVHAMLENGAMGYLTKNSPIDEIFLAIIEVQSGRNYICEEVQKVLKEEMGNQKNQKNQNRNSL